MPKGLLLVLMQPPSTLEEEFNAWYDTEHIPERKAVKGFETGLRYVCVEGGPKYLALYDLQRIEVLESEDYLAVSGDNFTPWTKRVTSRTRVHRAPCVQVYPGEATTGPCARLLLLRFRDLPASESQAVLAGMRKNFEGRPEVQQFRSFHYELDGTSHHVGLVEMRAGGMQDLHVGAFGSSADRLDLIATYRTY